VNQWRFLTNHGLVYLHKVLNPEGTVREIALDLGVTERAVHRILRDLERDGYLLKERIGRRAYYKVSDQYRTMRHGLVKDVDVKELLRAISGGKFPEKPHKAAHAAAPTPPAQQHPANMATNGGAAPVPAVQHASAPPPAVAPAVAPVPVASQPSGRRTEA